MDAVAPSMGFKQGPMMQHGQVTTNVTVDRTELSRRYRSSQRYGAARIAATTQADNYRVQSIQIGDALFREAGSAMRMIGVPKSVPNCIVFAAFNLMTPKEANDAVFMGFAQNNLHPGQGLGMDNPVIACVVHGMQSTLNNGPDTIEAGDVVVAVPPDVNEGERQLGDPKRTQDVNGQEHWSGRGTVSTTGTPGNRAVAVMRSMHSSYSVFFQRGTNSLPSAYGDFAAEHTTSQAFKDGLACFDDVKITSVYSGPGACVASGATTALGLDSDAHTLNRPFTALQVHLYAEMQQVQADTNYLIRTKLKGKNFAVDQVKAAHKDAFDGLLARLPKNYILKAYAEYAFGTTDETEIATQLKKFVSAFDVEYGFASTMLLTRLIVDHIDFMRTFYQTKVVGKAMAQSPPNSTLHLYVNPIVA